MDQQCSNILSRWCPPGTRRWAGKALRPTNIPSRRTPATLTLPLVNRLLTTLFSQKITVRKYCSFDQMRCFLNILIFSFSHHLYVGLTRGVCHVRHLSYPGVPDGVSPFFHALFNQVTKCYISSAKHNKPTFIKPRMAATYICIQRLCHHRRYLHGGRHDWFSYPSHGPVMEEESDRQARMSLSKVSASEFIKCSYFINSIFSTSICLDMFFTADKLLFLFGKFSMQ